MAEHFPVETDCDDEFRSRLRILTSSFEKKYNTKPDFFVRVPGRVNLIGEHVDYNGYDVCPMAIEQSFVVAVKAVDGLDVSISNTDNHYEDYSGKIDNLEIRLEAGQGPRWYNYALCGFKGIIEQKPSLELKGLKFHLHGTIPSSAGLSSSSALVCAAALSLNIILKTNFSRTELAELTAKSERYIGTQGGGMDQAIIFNAKYGMASRVSFNPLRLKEIHIPPSGVFVIAQSMAKKNKAASHDFNSRVVECRLSSLIIAKQNELKNWQNYTKLVDVQRDLKCDLPGMIKNVEDQFHNDNYSKEEVCQILCIDSEELEEKFLTKDTKHLNEFKLKPRALHVFGEALRTETFYETCQTNKSLTELGKLMFESHYSLRDLYECSHPILDKLVSICEKKGALGARLTGAGWGGCIVALVLADNAKEFVKSVKECFYDSKVPNEEDVDELIFITAPQDGAKVFSASLVEST